MVTCFSHSVLIETRVVQCEVEPKSDEIVIKYDLPDLAEVIRRGNHVPHVSDINLVKVNAGPKFITSECWCIDGSKGVHLASPSLLILSFRHTNFSKCRPIGSWCFPL